MFAPTGTEFYPEHLQKDLTADKLILRRERQCFRRLKSIEGILFSVRTYVFFFDELDKDEVEAFTRQVLMMTEEHAVYKQVKLWWPCTVQRCDELGIDLTQLEASVKHTKEGRKCSIQALRQQRLAPGSRLGVFFEVLLWELCFRLLERIPIIG